MLKGIKVNSNTMGKNYIYREIIIRKIYKLYGVYCLYREKRKYL